LSIQREIAGGGRKPSRNAPRDVSPTGTALLVEERPRRGFDGFAHLEGDPQHLPRGDAKPAMIEISRSRREGECGLAARQRHGSSLVSSTIAQSHAYRS
jgi:hypothetical protein